MLMSPGITTWAGRSTVLEAQYFCVASYTSGLEQATHIRWKNIDDNSLVDGNRAVIQNGVLGNDGNDPSRVDKRIDRFLHKAYTHVYSEYQMME